jgi:hypothetical protein
MPPFVASPLVRLALSALAGGAVIRWVTKEVRRINEELERVKDAAAVDRGSLPTLRRDPRTGEFRLM